MLPVFLIFVLLLANLAQLQPGTAAEPIFRHMSTQLSLFQRTYVPHLYVSPWRRRRIDQLLALGLGVLGSRALLAAVHVIRFAGWSLATAACGVLSIPLSFASCSIKGISSLGRSHQPTRTLLFNPGAPCAPVRSGRYAWTLLRRSIA